jgi:beta-glucosidase
MTDGPNGPRGTSYIGGTTWCAPCGSALGATWDTDLVARVGRLLGWEARRKDAHLILAPTVNLHRTPIGGRTFECFSEDPLLTAELAVAYVDGVQGQGVGCCIKHLVANDTEHERFTISSDVDERVLRELYLVPFEAAAAAGVRAMMAAYNRLNGTHCTEHEWLLTGVLRRDWNWDGIVVSDWWARVGTVEALVAGMDLEMPGPPRGRGEKLRSAVAAGDVPDGDLDRSVERLIRFADAMAAARAIEPLPVDDPAALLREAAAAGIVLLRNERIGPDGGPLLPLDPAVPATIAVVGPNADATAIQGGGSCHVDPVEPVTVLDGLIARFGAANVVHEPGPPASRSTPALDVRRVHRADGRLGLDIEYVAGTDPTGLAVSTEQAGATRLAWPYSPVSHQPWSARVTASLTPRVDGVHRFALRSAGTARLLVDETLVVDAAGAPGPESDGAIALAAGQAY